CTINVVFKISRTLLMRASTGLKINSNDWSYTKTTDKDTGKSVNNPSGFGKPKQTSTANKNLATDLGKLSIHLESEYNDDFTKGVAFNNDWLRAKINAFFDRDKVVEQKEDDNLFSVYLKNYIDFRKLRGETKPTTERKFNQLKTKYEKFEKKKRTKFLISDIDHKFILTFKKYMI